MSLVAGDLVLDRYVIDALVGSGGMGEVYRAHHAVLEHEVAIKVLLGPAAPVDTARFVREAQAMARVRHRAVTAVLDLGRLPSGAPCLAMEYVRGVTLQHLLVERETLPWPRAVALACQALDGLEAIHEAGIIHRDIKPANLMVVAGEREEVKVMDLGVARLRDDAARLTGTNATLGTPAYMAPEQAMSSIVDERADLYATALVLFECLTGSVPHAEAGLMAPVRRFYEPLPPLLAPSGRPEVPAQLAALIGRTLAPEPSARPASARELARLLRVVAAEHQDAGVRATAPIAIVAAAPPAGAARPASGTPTALGVATPPRVVTHPARLGHTSPPAPALPAPAVGGTLLFVARLPPSRLQATADRRWLAELAAGGRAFSLGGYLWIAIFEHAGADDDAGAQRPTELCARLRERYGSLIACAWDRVHHPVDLTPAMLTGGAPLPHELMALIDRQREGPPSAG